MNGSETTQREEGEIDGRVLKGTPDPSTILQVYYKSVFLSRHDWRRELPKIYNLTLKTHHDLIVNVKCHQSEWATGFVNHTIYELRLRAKVSLAVCIPGRQDADRRCAFTSLCLWWARDKCEGPFNLTEHQSTTTLAQKQHEEDQLPLLRSRDFLSTAEVPTCGGLSCCLQPGPSHSFSPWLVKGPGVTDKTLKIR